MKLGLSGACRDLGFEIGVWKHEGFRVGFSPYREKLNVTG